MNGYLKVDRSNGDESRIADYFTLTYAAARYAQEQGILPVTQPELRDAIVDVYRASREQQASAVIQIDPVARIKDYIARKSTEFLDLRDDPRAPSEGEIEDALGFITNERARKEYSFLRRAFMESLPLGLSGPQVCDALKEKEVLIHDNGVNVTKRQIGGERRWVYCIPARILDL